jgi:predicted nucleic acid-binding protein
MSFLLDTNVVSEPMKTRPNSRVLSWIADTDEDAIFISVVTITELRYGIERLAIGARRARLESWLTGNLLPRFNQRVLPVTPTIADACGRLVARSESLGRPIEPRDAFIAATAEVNGFTLVTRDVTDFSAALSALLSPWS